MSEQRDQKWIISVGLSLIMIICAVAVVSATFKRKCVDQAIVKQITAVNHRTSTLLLNDGRLVDVHQAVAAPGVAYCVKWE